jgi:8-oxo-dGTP pyrophosphatase MutT (NUDIX family)
LTGIFRSFGDIFMTARKNKPKAARGKIARRRQVAAIPIRRGSQGKPEVLLLTSRGTGRWVIPKGWPKNRLTGAETAALEAFEEAGLEGKINRHPIGRYSYVKRELRKNGKIKVQVFVLEVKRQKKHWPERQERRTRWVKAKRAATLVDEKDLARLLVRLHKLAPNLVS